MKRIALIALCAVLVAAAGAASGAKEPAEAQLVVGVLPDVDSIPLIIADMNGMFQDAGVSVRLERFTSPVVRDSAFQAGEIDGVVSDILAAVFARQAGMGVWITSATDGSYKLLASPASGLTSVASLAGKQVGISRNTVIEYCTDRMLERAGLASESVEKVAIPQIPIRMEMLNTSKIAAAVLPEPLAATARAAGARLLDASDRLGINPGVLLFSERALEQRSAQLTAFYRAYNDAVDYLATTPVEAYADELVAAAGFPEAVRRRLSLPEYRPAAAPDADEVREVGRWLEDKGLAKRVYSFEELVDTSVLPAR